MQLAAQLALVLTTREAEANARRFEGSLGGVGREAGQTAGSLRRVESAAESAGRQMRNLVGALGVGLGGREVLQLADSYTNAENAIRLTTDSTRELAEVQATTFRIAQETRTDLEGTVALYTRLDAQAGVLGASQRDIAEVTETVGKAMRLASNGAAGSAAALGQFNQAIGAGILRGEELNSILEGSPGLARTIAAGLGVHVGALKAMAEDGELTARRVFEAIKTQGDATDASFAKVQRTAGESFTVARNNAIQFVGALNTATGATLGFGDLVVTVSENLDLLAIAAGTVGAARAVLALNAAMRANAAAQAAAGIAGFSRALVAGQGIMAATRLSADAMWAALGGPIPKIIGLIFAAGSALLYLRGKQNEAREANENRVASLQAATNDELQMSENALRQGVEIARRAKEAADLNGKGTISRDERREQLRTRAELVRVEGDLSAVTARRMQNEAQARKEKQEQAKAEAQLAAAAARTADAEARKEAAKAAARAEKQSAADADREVERMREAVEAQRNELDSVRLLAAGRADLVGVSQRIAALNESLANSHGRNRAEISALVRTLYDLKDAQAEVTREQERARENNELGTFMQGRSRDALRGQAQGTAATGRLDPAVLAGLPQIVADANVAVEQVRTVMQSANIGEQVARDAAEGLTRGLQSGLTDFIRGGFDDFRSFLDGVSDLFADMLSNTLGTALTGVVGPILQRLVSDAVNGTSLSGRSGALAGTALVGFGVGQVAGGLTTNRAGGAALGALSGAAAGAAIGSVVPVVGTAVGAIVGAATGLVGGLLGSSRRAAEARRAQQEAELAEIRRQQEIAAQRAGALYEMNADLTLREFALAGDEVAAIQYRRAQQLAQQLTIINAGGDAALLERIRRVSEEETRREIDALQDRRRTEIASANAANTVAALAARGYGFLARELEANVRAEQELIEARRRGPEEVDAIINRQQAEREARQRERAEAAEDIRTRTLELRAARGPEDAARYEVARASLENARELNEARLLLEQGVIDRGAFEDLATALRDTLPDAAAVAARAIREAAAELAAARGGLFAQGAQAIGLDPNAVFAGQVAIGSQNADVAAILGGATSAEGVQAAITRWVQENLGATALTGRDQQQIAQLGTTFGLLTPILEAARGAGALAPGAADPDRIGVEGLARRERTAESAFRGYTEGQAAEANGLLRTIAARLLVLDRIHAALEGGAAGGRDLGLGELTERLDRTQASRAALVRRVS